MKEYIPLIIALLSGCVVLAGYMLQKHLELKQKINLLKQELYIDFATEFGSKLADSGYENQTNLKLKMILLSSDSVIKKYKAFNSMENIIDGTAPRKFNELLIAMRSDCSGQLKLASTL
jgi:hypothetical protein